MNYFVQKNNLILTGKVLERKLKIFIHKTKLYTFCCVFNLIIFNFEYFRTFHFLYFTNIG